MRYTWKLEYSLDDAAIDEQHRQLFELATLLDQAGEREGRERIIRNAFIALREYVNQHFEDEEQLLAAVASPLLEEHKSLHEELTAEFKQLWMASRLNLLNDVAESLSGWVMKRLIPHIMVADQKARWGHVRGVDVTTGAETSTQDRSVA